MLAYKKLLLLFSLFPYTSNATHRHIFRRAPSVRYDYMHQPKWKVEGTARNNVTRWVYKNMIQMEDEFGRGVIYDTRRKQYIGYGVNNEMEPLATDPRQNLYHNPSARLDSIGQLEGRSALDSGTRRQRNNLSRDDTYGYAVMNNNINNATSAIHPAQMYQKLDEQYNKKIEPAEKPSAS